MIIFVHAITSISIFPKRERERRIYSRKKRIGWKYGIIPIFETKNYVCNRWNNEEISLVEEYNSIATKSYVENNIVYYKPHCKIFMNNKSHQSVYFDTEEELYEYTNNLIAQAPHIEIENEE